MQYSIDRAGSQIMIHVNGGGSRREEVARAFSLLQGELGDSRPLCGRIFCDDFGIDIPDGFSCSGQRCLDGGVALWAMCGDSDELIYTPMMYGDTTSIFESYDAALAGEGMSLADNCIRTWCFMADIDDNYGDFARKRTEYFYGHGLRPDTHYIASTGIEGTMPEGKVGVEAMALRHPEAASVQYLQGRESFCRTHDYGVTFERGTAFTISGVRYAFISGTASIDAAGRIMHEGDPAAQARRMLDNVRVLLVEAGMDMGDVTQAIIYLRNDAQLPDIEPIVRESLESVPMVFLHAPVCRPGWLVEIECIAEKVQD